MPTQFGHHLGCCNLRCQGGGDGLPTGWVAGRQAKGQVLSCAGGSCTQKPSGGKGGTRATGRVAECE